MEKDMLKKKLKAAVIGHLVGDALGVPVEFKSREFLSDNPVENMQGYGSYNLPLGSWSDDGSLTLCLLKSLSENGYDLSDQADRFISWLDDGYLTPYGESFGVGRTTRKAIERLKDGIRPFEAGPANERDNGNGSLMRILPLAFFLLDKDYKERFKIVKEVSSLTHGHERSILACYIYIDFVIRLIKGKELKNACIESSQHILQFIDSKKFKSQLKYFKKIIDNDIGDLREKEINSSAYVVDTLEAFFWILLNSSSYSEAVLKAVNLGGDTDTTAAVCGGAAALYYGFEDIPESWVESLAKKDEIFSLIEGFSF